MSLISTYILSPSKETWVPSKLILDISQPSTVSLRYHYKFTNFENTKIQDQITLQTFIAFGLYSNRIMTIEADLGKVSDPITAILEDLKKFKDADDFLGFNPNHQFVYKETLRIFSK